MGSCGKEEIEKDDITLRNPPLTTTMTTAMITGETTKISPMNTNFQTLIITDILRIIFEKLSVTDLARAACVCRFWNSIASDRDIQTSSFKSPWKLKDIVGNPSSRSFWRDNSLSKFAISHRIDKIDSITSLAVKYSVQVVDIKRLNNMISDHGIYSRERLLIPVSNPNILVNSTCYIELDLYAKREVAVLYLEGGPVAKRFGYSPTGVTSDLGKRRVIESLRRSMQVDDGTVQYYLAISDGDPRAAISEFSEDLNWERHTGMA